MPRAACKALTQTEQASADRPAHVWLRSATTAAVTSSKASATPCSRGPEIDDDKVTACLPGGPVKEIDLAIRTSGEFRPSGFFPCQTARSEIYVSPRHWPNFTTADLATALHHFAGR